jgi:tetratricopeptide (TPR) repeat protein
VSDPTRNIMPPGIPAAAPAATLTRDAHDPTTAPDAQRRVTSLTLPAAGGRYEFVEELARGGMGVVYSARDTVLGREVAVKVLQDRFGSSSDAAERFVDEARIAGQLQHPGIPAVHDLGTLPDGRPFLAMKLVNGQTLEEHLRDRTDPAQDRGRFLAVFEQVCQAVGYAHENKVIHRDLKPANVMVGGFGEVQIMDWGLAKVLAGREREEPECEPAPRAEIRTVRESSGSYTEAGSVLGTPAYMPPEQAVGAVGQVDERSDVFGLGAILAVILTGQPPFVGDSGESLRVQSARGKVSDCFARLDACGAEPELVALCKRCLAPDKDDRPANAGEVARAVAGLRDAAGDRARRAELARVAAETRAAEQRKRRKVQAALGLSFTALVVLGGAFAWWREHEAGRRTAEAEARTRDEQERLARNGQAVAELIARCEQALRDGDPERAAEALGEVDRRLAEGGGEAMADRAALCRRDLALLEELDRIDNFRWTPAENHLPDRATVAARWAGAFAPAGIVPGTKPPAEVARLVAGSNIRDRILGALDLWLVFAPSHHLVDDLRAADPDRYRDAVRAAIAARDDERMGNLVSQGGMREQPTRFVVVVGSVDYIPVERKRALLERAAVSRPDVLNVLMELRFTYPVNATEGAWERVRWFQAAAAARPRNSAAHFNLGKALHDLGDVDAAIAAYKEAIKCDPSYVHVHHTLGLACQEKRDMPGACAGYQKAVQIDPRFALGHNNLGWILAVGPDGVRDGKRAVEHATRACELTNWTEPEFIDTLASAYAEVGEFEKAIECQKKALSFPEFDKRCGEGSRPRLELFAQRMPFREPAFAPHELAPPPREALK